VIPTYNSRKWLDGCLASIVGAGREPDVIQVVDNGSTDGTPDYLARRWPDIMLLRLDRNLGYGGAVNAGAALWPRHDVLALNIDTNAAPGAVDRLVAALASDNRLAVVAPRLRNADGSVQRSMYEFPSLARFARQVVGLDSRDVRRLVAADAALSGIHAVDWAPGVALLVRRHAWDAVGGFDPAYRFFVEEVDLQRRLRDAGWGVAVDPAAEVTHHGGNVPRPAALFALSHDGWERYFGSREGRVRQVMARALLCAIAATRCTAWLALAASRPARRREALRWAAMFAGTIALSAARLPAAALRRHPPYVPPHS
jgi:N-acetylglucosaminyl-diphospho-decaprenol L-rhamnosyltransferase